MPGKVTEYTYSPLDLLTTVCDDGGELVAYDYNPDGTVKSLVHGFVRQDYTYDLDKNLVGLLVQFIFNLDREAVTEQDANGITRLIRSTELIARFTQEDTYRGDGLNLYAYCANNPVYYADPTGNMTECMKEAYKENHVDQNPRSDVPVPSDCSMSKEDWHKAYQAARGQGRERYEQDFADLARYRCEQRMPVAGSENDKDTAARLIIDENNVYYGRNGGRTRKDLLTQFDRANAITPTHTEGDVFYQAYLDIETGRSATLVVDRYPCDTCGYNGGIRSLDQQMGIESITIVTTSSPPIVFNPQKQPRPNPFKKQK